MMMRYKRIPTRDGSLNHGSHEINTESDSDGQAESSGVNRVGNLISSGNQNKSASSQGDKLGSGHFDPLQRKIYLGLHVFSLSTALVGFILLCIWIFKYKDGVSLSDTKKLGNLHALFMYTFMVGLNAYGVLVYRTFFSATKEKVKWTHAILSFFNIVMAITGVSLMFISHNANGQANLYTLHSWIGLTTTTLYVSQFLFGFVTFLRPGLSQSIRAQSMPFHRFTGIAVLAMAGLAAITGISEWAIWSVKEYNKFVPMTFIANFAGISVLVSTLVSVFLLSQNKYRRPTDSDLHAHQMK